MSAERSVSRERRTEEQPSGADLRRRPPIRRNETMSASSARPRVRTALLVAGALLAFAAPAAQAGPTTPADIDAVPRLRAQLDERAAQTAAPATPVAPESDSFGWDDAGIAAALLAAGGAAGVATSRVRRRPQQPAPSIG
jgi:hypothetical protein